jgi:hypothetical protein
MLFGSRDRTSAYNRLASVKRPAWWADTAALSVPVAAVRFFLLFNRILPDNRFSMPSIHGLIWGMRG